MNEYGGPGFWSRFFAILLAHLKTCLDDERTYIALAGFVTGVTVSHFGLLLGLSYGLLFWVFGQWLLIFARICTTVLFNALAARNAARNVHR